MAISRGGETEPDFAAIRASMEQLEDAVGCADCTRAIAEREAVRWNAAYDKRIPVVYCVSGSRRYTVTTTIAFIHERRACISLAGMGCVPLRYVTAIEREVTGAPA